ncbi:DUF2478 domain-containing protein [Actibacterium sp.]|uniref:DUF2478 domain-containing protein n=1 Tax=Actibacterium sp. TaxID=1872125 RepID=UPI0035619940
MQDGPRSTGIGETCKEIYLFPIGSTHRFAVTQDLGTGARGCKLNPQGLAECCVRVADDLTKGADLLAINRFGRSESIGQAS